MVFLPEENLPERTLKHRAGWSNAVQIKGKPVTITALGNNEFKVDLKAGEEIVLSGSPEKRDIAVHPVSYPEKEKNIYGVKRGKQLSKDQSWPLPEYKVE